MTQDLQLEVALEPAQAITLVRAVEETDRRGLALSHAARRTATAAARSQGEDEAWLARRATALLPELEARWTFVPRLMGLTNLGKGLLVPVAAVALGAGLATNALGPERQIHVLALPLAGILAWNVAVLVFLAIRRWVPFGRSAWRRGRPYLLGGLEDWGRRLVDRLPRQATDEPDLVRDSLEEYLKQWISSIAPLAAARVRCILHLAALLLLVGVVAGMYLRGVVFAYQATWESTFLDAATVDGILGAILAPAAAISGLEIPPAQRLERSGPAEAAGGDAAPWIHLWAMTAALFAAVPRTLLAAVEVLKVVRLSRRLPIRVSTLYLRRLLASVSSDTRRIEVIPYSCRLSAALADTFRARLLDVFGNRSNVRIRSPVEYGAKAAELELTAGRSCLVLFNLAQTPEVEVHGAFLTAIIDELHDGQDLVVVTDGSALRERLAASESGEKRWQERRRTWDRVAAEVGLEIVHLDLRLDDADTIVRRLMGDGKVADG